ncbi:hypothetical protein D7Y13_31625 [Corallococcus praedator]|uniref:Uncharacterized protein n=1 Tax=Corallococcus praedator TaxID=2316724 RepID=A0ABX9QC21_9BACT|nr:MULTISPECIES: hypothetical protein [Corallococcus]RKH13817.1 hypothetical protein D7X74_21135 [Corallococcus sp. CA047B]RKH29291.1 hypothetical protein D7X75_23155 [Corallococcus sp. CA031C]RKH95913.1 hypothetical protein D7Y13_31625 [Corallococcus praedator]
MAADPKQSEVMKQINEAFQAAESKLAKLREAVERNTELARANGKAAFLKDKKEQTHREFGEAVWQSIQQGRLTLPPGFDRFLAAIAAAEKASADHAAQLTDLLREGEEAAERLKVSKPPVAKSVARPQTVVATGTKKR